MTLYDSLKKRYTQRSAVKKYLNILYLAAKESESLVDNALRVLIDKDMDICDEQVEILMQSEESVSVATDIDIPEVNLTDYDQLLEVMPC